jgi:hypothetical protein
MSARNGQRARFHRNRKRRVVRLMRLRAVMHELQEPKPDAAPPAASSKRGPALKGRT